MPQEQKQTNVQEFQEKSVYEMIDWPSDQVPPGGVFHTRRASYSKDTQNLLQVLMEEAKLSNLQRNKIHYFLRTGDPLPRGPDEGSKATQSRSNDSFIRDVKRMEHVRRRPLEVIKSSGAFERAATLAGPFREPTDMAKKRLQSLMSGIKGTPRTSRRMQRSLDESQEVHHAPQDQIEECEFGRDEVTRRATWLSNTSFLSVLREIRDRTEWLEDMERLGQGKKYRTMIQNQIASKLREIKRLERTCHEENCLDHLEEQLERIKM